MEPSAQLNSFVPKLLWLWCFSTATIPKTLELVVHTHDTLVHNELTEAMAACPGLQQLQTRQGPSTEMEK